MLKGKLTGIQTTIWMGEGIDLLQEGWLSHHCEHLVGVVPCLGIIPNTIKICIDLPLLDLTTIIHIGKVGIWKHRLVNMTHWALEQITVQVDVEFHVGCAVETVSGTNRLVVVNLVIYLQTCTEITGLVFLIHLINDLFGTLVVVIELDGFICAHLDVLCRTRQHGWYIKTSLTIVDICLVRYARTIITESFQLISKTPALPLRALGLDTYHRLGGCSITGTGIRDNLNIQDLVGWYLIQFLVVIELTTVHIDLSRTSSESFHTVIGTLYGRQSLEQILWRSDLL